MRFNFVIYRRCCAFFKYYSHGLWNEIIQGFQIAKRSLCIVGGTNVTQAYTTRKMTIKLEYNVYVTDTWRIFLEL